MIFDEWQFDFAAILEEDLDLASIQFDQGRLSHALLQIRDFLVTDGGRLFMEATRQSLGEVIQFHDIMVVDREKALEDAALKAQYKLLILLMSGSLGMRKLIQSKVDEF